ncbi:acyltransferase family protein [Weissella confusa]|uniref:acyltransferase family protein n=1 Tax=Weissella confusa TaxID=1583 RepID=UPI0035A2ED20
MTNYQFVSLWTIENIVIIAVNIFAMTTGYLMNDKKIKYLRVWDVIVQTSFWAPVMAAIVFVFGGFDLSVKLLVESIFPVLLGRYWYVTAYIVMMIVAPFINLGFQRLPQLTIKKILALLVILSVSVGFLGKMFLESGYSAGWLITMYAVGGYIKKFTSTSSFNTYKLLLVWVTMALISSIGEFGSHLIGNVGLKHFISYVSPIVVVESLSAFILFVKLEVRNHLFKQVISRISPLTFGAYLINGSVFYEFLANKNVWMMNYNVGLTIAKLLAFTVLMYIVFLIMEYARNKLFALLHVNDLMMKVYDGVMLMFGKTLSRFVV